MKANQKILLGLIFIALFLIPFFWTMTIGGDDGNDNFGRVLISFLIILLVSGGISYRYGIASESAILGIIFGIVAFLDVGLNFIPNPVNAIPHFITILLAFIMITLLIKEELK